MRFGLVPKSARKMLCVLALLASACSSDATEAALNTPTASPSPAASPTTVPTPAAVATAAPSPAPPTVAPQSTPVEVETGGEMFGFVAAAPLGTYVVARPGAGLGSIENVQQAETVSIPVYDMPGGPPRTLLDVNTIDGGVEEPVHLVNWPDSEGALVLRVVAGGADDEWLQVQAPARPNNSYVWVKRSDFDFGFTSMRIEIDLAQDGGLTLFDGDVVLLATDIVHGRDSRPTPTQVTYIERGIPGSALSQAYGTSILSMASFSEALGTFSGGLPSNYLHGTNQPDLIGQRVSSGEIRVPNDVLDEIVETITPGTPVLIFNSSLAHLTAEAVLGRPMTAAQTMAFDNDATAVLDVSKVVTPQLWRRCSVDEPGELLCRADEVGS